MRYIYAHQTVVDHWVEERDINLTFHDDDEVMLEGNGRNVAFQRLHKRWDNEVKVWLKVCNGSKDGGNWRHVGDHGVFIIKLWLWRLFIVKVDLQYMEPIFQRELHNYCFC